MDDLKFLFSRYSSLEDDDDRDLNINNLVSAALAGKILAAAADSGGGNDPFGQVTSRIAQANPLSDSVPTVLPDGSSGTLPASVATPTASSSSYPTPSISSTPTGTASSAEVTSAPIASPSATSALPLSSGTDVIGTATSSSASSTESSTALADASGGASQSKSFMDNKPLAISVITVSTVAGLALIIVLLTCLMRRRRRSKIHQEAACIPQDQVMGPPPVMDIEKASSPKGSPGVGHYGAMSRAGSLRRGSNDSGIRGALDPAPGPEMTQHTASSVFVPADTNDIRSAHPQLSPGQRHSFSQEHRIPDHPPQIPNPFDDAHAVASDARVAPLNFAFAAGVASVGSVARSSPIQRKPPPHLSLNLDTVQSESHTTYKSEPSPQSAVSHDGNPLQHANTVNTGRIDAVDQQHIAVSAQSALSYVTLASPPLAYLMPSSPKTAGPIGTSFASGNQEGSSLQGHKRSSSVESMFDRSDAPPFPVAMISPLNLPEESELSPKLPKGDKGKKPMRTLKVVNL